MRAARRCVLAAALALAAGGAGRASAGIVLQERSIDLAGGSGSLTLTFDKVGPLEGKLTDVIFDLIVTYAGADVGLRNNDPVARDFRIGWSQVIDLDAPGLSARAIKQGVLRGTLAPNSEETYRGPDLPTGGSWIVDEPGPYEGTGTFQVHIIGSAGADIFSLGDVVETSSTPGSLTGVLRMTYLIDPPTPAAVPEPSTVASAGVGGLLCLVLAIGRRRKAA